MIIQLNTDNNIKGTEALETFVNKKVRSKLKNFIEHITRIEVHLSDENAEKAGPDDIKCKIEARVKGRQPVLVESNDGAKEKALDEAADKMKTALGSIIGKAKNK